VPSIFGTCRKRVLLRGGFCRHLGTPGIILLSWEGLLKKTKGNIARGEEHRESYLSFAGGEGAGTPELGGHRQGVQIPGAENKEDPSFLGLRKLSGELQCGGLRPVS